MTLHWSEEFIETFQDLKRKTNNKPNRVGHAVKTDRELNDLVARLEFTLVRNVIEKRQTSNQRLATHIKPGFTAAFDEYLRKWQKPCTDAFFANLDLERLLEELEIDQTVVEKSSDNVEGILDQNDPGTLDDIWREFDPVRDNAAVIIDDLMGFVSDTFENKKDDPSASINFVDTLSAGLGAWDWLGETIGLSLPDIVSRWKKLPFTFVPEHVSNSQATEGHGSLYQMLNEAMRAYVFGAPLASLALCRSLTEVLLKQHYLPGQDDDLVDLIRLAEDNCYWLKHENLQSKRLLANAIIHRDFQKGSLSGDEDDTALNWLATLKLMIERAPAAPTK
jgi:hypothetical protein